MLTDPYDDGPPPALGAVLEQDRGSLPYALIHGEALIACAVWSLGESGVTPVDLGTEWEGLVDGGEPFVVHDSLCPMTPPSFITECLVRAVDSDTVVVGVRPVTDTVKVVREGVVGETVDRSALLSVASPIVLPARVVAALDRPAVRGLRGAGPRRSRRSSGSTTSRRRCPAAGSPQPTT